VLRGTFAIWLSTVGRADSNGGSPGTGRCTKDPLP
jgi:hypothetical protein